MLQNALDLSAAETSAESSEAVPAWAADALNTLSGYGMELDAESPLTRGDAAQIMYRISQLKSEAPGFLALRAAQ
jgi:hypothetical protein